MKETQQTIIRMIHICNANIVALDMVASEPTQTQ